MIDIEKFICSLLADHPVGVTVREDIHKALKDQGLEYKGGKIVPIEDKTALQESEDERIRKAIYNCVEWFGFDSGFFRYASQKDCLAWLEKQCRQKEINLVEILKHYPKETELYSPLYGKLWLAEVDEKNEIITCYKHPLDEGCTRAVLEQEDTVSFYSNGTTGLPDFNVSKDCMLFLYDIEKQGEKGTNGNDREIPNSEQPADKVEPKFHEGDWVVSPNGVYWHIDAIRDGRYQVSSNSGECTDWSLYTNIYHKFTIQDAKAGDILASCGDENPFIFKGCIDTAHPNAPVAYCGIDAGNNFCDCTTSTNWWTGSTVRPATKEQRDLLFQKMREAGYEWDAEKKELKKIEQKPTWSEEDEKKRNYLIALLQNSTMHNSALRMANEGIEDWLKSLKDRYTWKPSGEQMEALSWCVALLGGADHRVLGELYEQLKKLREE